MPSQNLRLLLVFLAAFAFYGFNPETGRAQGLDAIFTEQSNGAIINILTTTGATNTLYTATGHYWNGAAYDPINQNIYIDDIGQNSFSPNTPITNTIYSLNIYNPSAGVTEVGTITGQAAFTGAGFYNGLYYAIGTGSNQLVSYNLNGHSGAGAIAQNSTQTLGGLGTGVTGLSLGDIDFIGSTVYISSGTVSSTAPGAAVSGTYTLYKYSTITNTTTPVYAVSEGGEVGVGIANDVNSGLLLQFNSDGTIYNVNPLTGAETYYSTAAGLAGVGAGDFTIVPEPRSYAVMALAVLLGLVAVERKFRSRLRIRLA